MEQLTPNPQTLKNELSPDTALLKLKTRPKKSKRGYSARKQRIDAMIAKHESGRPALYSRPEVLEAKITEYFTKPGAMYQKTRKDATGQEYTVSVPTITDLVLYLGFVDRTSFYDYENREGFSHIIKKARSMIEREYESLLHTANCTGAIFALKNFGWIDKVEGNVNVNFSLTALIANVDRATKENPRSMETITHS